MCSTQPSFTERNLPDLTGYVALVTGGNSGVGYETTKQLARHSARVYVSSRFRNRVNQAIRKMRDETGQDLDLRFLQIDLTDLRSVVNLLFNNAGVMNWQVDYLAPFVFPQKLLSLMLYTASTTGSMDRVRIVNIISDLSLNIGLKDVHFEDVNRQRYAHSKQGSMRHAEELNDRYAHKSVTAHSVHPGVIPSNLQSAEPGFVGTMMQVGMKFRRTTALDGCYNSLYCAKTLQAFQEGQGRYLTPVGEVNSKADVWLADKEGNARLLRWSEEVMERSKWPRA